MHGGPTVSLVIMYCRSKLSTYFAWTLTVKSDSGGYCIVCMLNAMLQTKHFHK